MIIQAPHWEVPIPYLPHLVVAEEGLIRREGTTGKAAEAVRLRTVSLKTVFLHSMFNIFYVLSYC